MPRTAPLGMMAQLATWLDDTYVRGRPPLMRLGVERYSRRLREQTGLSSFRIEVSRQGRIPATECRSITTVPAPAEVARCLGLPAGIAVVRREIWYAADDEPVQLAYTFIPLEVAGDSVLATATTLGAGALYGRLDELGHTLSHMRDQVTTRLPTADEAAALRAPAGVPVLDVLHTSLSSVDSDRVQLKGMHRSVVLTTQYDRHSGNEAHVHLWSYDGVYAYMQVEFPGSMHEGIELTLEQGDEFGTVLLNLSRLAGLIK